MLRERECFLKRQCFKKFFGPFVDIAELCLKFDDFLPKAVKRKCPGSIIPAWTGPTGI
jgi:hypothetical protein